MPDAAHRPMGPGDKEPIRACGRQKWTGSQWVGERELGRDLQAEMPQQSPNSGGPRESP